MKKLLIVSVFALWTCFLSNSALAVGASIGQISRIYHNSDGYTYILLASGNDQSNCVFGVSYGSHRINRSDSDYHSKLSLLMLAFGSNKTVHLQDNDPTGPHTYCDVDIITVTSN